MKNHLLAAILILLTPISANGETLRYLFDVRLAVGKIGEMQVLVENTGTAYSATGALYTTGLVGALYDARYDSYAEGRVDGRRLNPVRYTSTSNEKGTVSTAEITYSGNRVTRVRFTPAKPVPQRATSERNTIDPMSLIYQLIRPVSVGDVCKGDYKLFDGQKRMTVSYTNLKRYTNGRVECDIVYSGTGNNGGISLSAAVFNKGADGLMYIDRFTANTNIGTLSVSLRK